MVGPDQTPEMLAMRPVPPRRETRPFSLPTHDPIPYPPQTMCSLAHDATIYHPAVVKFTIDTQRLRVPSPQRRMELFYSESM